MHFYSGQMVSRNSAGAAWSILILILVPVGLLFGSLAVDVGHMSMVRTEMQNAVDAAAMAGAKDLIADPNNVVAHALNIAGQNKADGRPVATSTRGDTVRVDVSLPTILSPGMVRVTASMPVQHLLSPLFARTSDVVTVSAVASGSGTLSQVPAGSVFPLAVTIAPSPAEHGNSPSDSTDNSNGNDKDEDNGGGNDKENGNGNGSEKSDNTVPPLQQLHIGDVLTLNINSQQYKNAAFTSFSAQHGANTIESLVDQALGFAVKNPVDIPPVEIGSSINLTNGVADGKKLASSPQYQALLTLPVAILPVINDPLPLNGSASVIGFIAVKFLDVTTNQPGGNVLSFRVQLVKAAVSSSGDTTADLSQYGTLDELSPVKIRLVNTGTFQ